MGSKLKSCTAVHSSSECTASHELLLLLLLRKLRLRGLAKGKENRHIQAYQATMETFEPLFILQS